MKLEYQNAPVKEYFNKMGGNTKKGTLCHSDNIQEVMCQLSSRL